MLVYAILILLPTVTTAFLFAPCDKELLQKLYDAVDKNHDTNITEKEVFDFVKALDVNGDGILTLSEIKNRSSKVAPELVNKEDYLFELLDTNHDGKITPKENKSNFSFIDRNGDGIKTQPEWDRFVKYLCPLINPKWRLKSSCSSNCGKH